MELVTQQLGIKKNSPEFKRVYQVAIHSTSDSDFFYKMSVVGRIKPRETTNVKEEKKINILVNEYKNDKLPAIFKDSLRELSKND